MKKAPKGSLRQFVTLLGLAALCILYLLEVDYSRITPLNWVAFGIIALALVPLAVWLIAKAVRAARARQARRTSPEDEE